jgi:hypothetical protein
VFLHGALPASAVLRSVTWPGPLLPSCHALHAIQAPPPSFPIWATPHASLIQVPPWLHVLPLSPSGFALLTVGRQAKRSCTILFSFPNIPSVSELPRVGRSTTRLPRRNEPPCMAALEAPCQRAHGPEPDRRLSDPCIGSRPVSYPHSSCRRCRPRPRISSL